MSSIYRPSDDTIGIIFLGGLIGLVGGAILGRSLLFFLLGMMTLLGLTYAIVKGGGASGGSERSKEHQRPRDQS